MAWRRPETSKSDNQPKPPSRWQDKASGITNNPNDWGKETNNPRYVLDLLASVVDVSVETVDIVADLPNLNVDTPRI